MTCEHPVAYHYKLHILSPKKYCKLKVCEGKIATNKKPGLQAVGMHVTICRKYA